MLTGFVASIQRTGIQSRISSRAYRFESGVSTRVFLIREVPRQVLIGMDLLNRNNLGSDSLKIHYSG
jgi:hypothetical protein